MSADTVCRVCLISDKTLYNVQNDLQNVYERIAREKYNKVGYPVHMCYICLTVLRKCQRLMKTAQDTNIVLQEYHQNEMRVARPLYTYSISKKECVIIDNENMTLQNNIKVEEMESEHEAVQQAFPECNTDVNKEETDTDGQTNYSELLVNDSTDIGTVEDNNDTQTESLFVDHEDYKEIRQSALNINANIETRIKLMTPHDNDALPTKKCKTNNTKPQHQAPETSVETAANETTSLNNTPSHPYNIRHRNTKTKPAFGKNNLNRGETEKLGKTVKTNVIRYNNKRLARNTINNSKMTNKLALNLSVLKKDEINTFDCKTTVQQHVTRRITGHTDEKRFKCDICDYQSNKQFNLTTHMRTHTGEKPFTCNTCNYKCNQKSSLVQHMRTHTGEKPFTCNTCNYKCKQKSNLVHHTKTHTGEKPFTCNACNYKCKLKSHLVQHTKTHTGEKPFTCNTCNYKCNHKSNLVLHTRTHTGEKPFTCNTCNYKCNHKSDLVRHTRTHTGEKPFTCNTCNYKCKQRAHLVQHTKTHTGEKPFACDICHYKCSRMDNLKLHLLTQHVNKKRK